MFDTYLLPSRSGGNDWTMKKEKNECLERARLDENHDHVDTYVLYHRKSIFVDHTFK